MGMQSAEPLEGALNCWLRSPNGWSHGCHSRPAPQVNLDRRFRREVGNDDRATWPF